MSGIIIKWLQFHIYDVFPRLTCMEWINLLVLGIKEELQDDVSLIFSIHGFNYNSSVYNNVGQT